MKIASSLLFCLVFKLSFSQFIQPETKDSIISSLYQYKFENALNNDSLSFIDTVAISLVNQPNVFFNLSTNLGNNGTSILPLTFEKFNQPIGFFGQFDFLNFYRFNKSNNYQYKVNKAYTEFQYLNGTNTEERFSVIHVQNIRNQINVGFEFNSLKSDGFFDRQFTQHRNVGLFSNFSNKQKNYYAEAGFFLNRSLIFENGGLNDIRNLIDNTLPDNLLPINLIQASNKSENRSFYFNQFYIPIKSSNQDSIASPDELINQQLVFYQKFEFNQTNYLFADLTQDSNYYENIGFSSSLEFWSRQNFQEIDNSLGFIFQPKKFPLKTNFSLNQQFVTVGNYLNKENLANQFFQIQGSLPMFKILQTSVDYSQVFAGYNIGDGRLRLNSNLDLTKFYSVGFTFKSQTTTVPYVYTNFFGTSFQYQNDLLKERINEISVNQSLFNFLKIDIGSGLFNNGVYFTEDLKVNQSNTLDEYVFINFNLKAENKRFFVSADTRWQQYSNTQLLPLPNFISFSRAYIKGWIFDHHMFVNLGFDLFYTSQFRGFGFSPLNRQFYTNNTAQRFGNYPFVDLFFAAKVKTARIFVKASHLNQGFSGNNYLLATNYPYHGFSLRLGFAWSFLN